IATARFAHLAMTIVKKLRALGMRCSRGRRPRSDASLREFPQRLRNLVLDSEGGRAIIAVS
ncbi:MAG TPA: hypothetical protein PLQ52_12260, partial [Lacunisphaera sp.]|nr:hypothetical protein [Lacunisphaera sp.]